MMAEQLTTDQQIRDQLPDDGFDVKSDDCVAKRSHCECQNNSTIGFVIKRTTVLSTACGIVFGTGGLLANIERQSDPLIYALRWYAAGSILSGVGIFGWFSGLFDEEYSKRGIILRRIIFGIPPIPIASGFAIGSIIGLVVHGSELTEREKVGDYFHLGGILGITFSVGYGFSLIKKWWNPSYLTHVKNEVKCNKWNII